MANEANVTLVIRVREFVAQALERVRAQFRGTAQATASEAARIDSAVADAGQTIAELPTATRDAAAALREMDRDTRRLAQEVRALDAADEARVAEVRRSIVAQRDLAREVGASALQMDRLREVERRLDDRVARLARQNAAALAAQEKAAREAAGATGLLGRVSAAASTGPLAGFFGGIRTGTGSVLAMARGLPLIGTAITGITAAIGSAQLGRWLLESNREFQRLTAQLRTFTGSAEAAQQKFEELQEAALLLPFELRNITQAYISLRGAGLDPTSSMMEAFSNVAVAAQQDIADLGAAIRAAATGEMERLKAFNVTARVEGEQLAVTFNGVTTRIGRDAASIAAYLYDLGRIQFAGASIRQMDTLDGKISTLQDNLFKLATAIGRGGFTDAVTEATEELIQFTNAIVENEAEVAYWTQLVLAIGGAIWQSIAVPARQAWNVVTATVRLVDLVVQSVATAINGAVWVALKAFDLLTLGQSKTVKAALTEVERQMASSTAAIQRDARGIVTDVRDAADAASDFTGAWAQLGRAANATTADLNTLTAAERQNVQARQQAIDAIRTEIQLRRNLPENERKLQQIIRDSQAEINRLRAEGVAWTDRYLQELQRQMVAAAQGITQAQAAARAGSSGGGKGKDPLDERIDLLARAAVYDETRARALEGLSKVEAHINGLLQRRNLTLEQETALREKLQKVQEARAGTAARDEARSKEVELLLEGAALREEHAEAIALLERRERELARTVEAGEAATTRRTAAEAELGRVRSELAQARAAELAQGDGDPAAQAEKVAELERRERDLTATLVIANREITAGVAAAGALANARAELARVTTAFTGGDLQRLLELERQVTAELDEEHRKLAAGNGERERAVRLARELLAIEERLRALGARREGGAGTDAAGGPGGAPGTTAAQPGRAGALPPTGMLPGSRTLEQLGQDASRIRLQRLPMPDQAEQMNVLRDALDTIDISPLDRLALALNRVAERAGAGTEQMRSLKGIIAEIADAGLEALGDAAIVAFEHIMTGSGNAAEAFKNAMFGAIAAVARQEGMLALAGALKALAQGLLGDPKAFAAAAKFTAAAAAYFAVAAAAGLGGGGGGGAGGGAAGSYERQREELDGTGRGEAVIEFLGGHWDPDDPRQLESFVEMLEAVSDKRVTVRVRPRGGR